VLSIKLIGIVTATGEHQAPVHNIIGKSIVDAVVRASREGRKFRVIIVIPAVPGFAGDLRQDAALGTRAIMDYQYKSLHRGEHSIFEQIRKQGVEPEKHIFVFNLRSYDRLNTTPVMKKQEEESGVKYQDVQRAEAEEIMGTTVHDVDSDGEDKDGDGKVDYSSSSDDEEVEKMVDQKRKFEAKREAAEEKTGDKEQKSADTIAKNALHGEPNVTDEFFPGSDDELEKDNFFQEELYIHGKCLIVDDRIVIVGSSNINDRSQIGFHDSELSIVMEDTNYLDSTMNGQPYKAGRHAATFRRMLWREHLGLIPPQPLDATDDANAQPPGDSPNDVLEGEHFEFVADPLDDKVWEMWTGQADVNTEVFRELFHADPDNASKLGSSRMKSF
jgi:phospholipase D1/2